MVKDSNIKCPACGKPFENDVYRNSGWSPLRKHIIASKDDEHKKLSERIKSNN